MDHMLVYQKKKKRKKPKRCKKELQKETGKTLIFEFKQAFLTYNTKK